MALHGTPLLSLALQRRKGKHLWINICFLIVFSGPFEDHFGLTKRALGDYVLVFWSILKQIKEIATSESERIVGFIQKH